MFSTHYAKMKCGYCGWIMPDDLSELNKHKCFETFNDEVDIIRVDDNKVVTMNTRETTDEQQEQQCFKIEYKEWLGSPISRYSRRITHRDCRAEKAFVGPFTRVQKPVKAEN